MSGNPLYVTVFSHLYILLKLTYSSVSLANTPCCKILKFTDGNHLIGLKALTGKPDAHITQQSDDSFVSFVFHGYVRLPTQR